jgi:two-component system phosphate regulon response regulator PhoB
MNSNFLSSPSRRDPRAECTPRVVLADDDPDLLDLVRTALTRAGFQVEATTDGLTALGKIREVSPTLALLDWRMPGLRGIEVCRLLKRDTATAGIGLIMISGGAGEDDRIKALEAGFDDYLSKPFSPRELVLRVEAMARGFAGGRPLGGVWQVGDIFLDCARREVRVREREVYLTPTEFSLLKMFAASGEFIQTREKLLVELTGSTSGIEIRTVDTHIRRLRNKLGVAGEQLQTVRGFGYRLTKCVSN